MTKKGRLHKRGIVCYDKVMRTGGIKLYYRGVIFDFNGTLFFDSDKHEQAWSAMSEKLRGKPFTSDEMRTHMHGRNGKMILAYLLGRMPTEKETAQLTQEKESHYRELCLKDPEHLHLAPGAQSLLNWLEKHRVPKAIATASDIHNVTFYQEQFHISTWFAKEQIIYDDGTLKGKPDPDIYERAAQRLNLAPQDCIVFEDAISGIESARRAGAGKIIAVASFEPRETYQSNSAVSQIIEDFDQFDAQKWLKSMD